MSFRIGVVGAGTHGERYVRHATQDVAGMQVSALCRRSPEPGRALAKKYRVRYHAEATALIRDPDVDGVVICTPPGSHFELAAAALRAGKPTLLEKPMCGSLAEAARLVDLAGSAPRLLMIGHSLRWNPVIGQVRALWPQLGRVHLIRLAQRLAPTTLAWQQDRAQTVGGSVLLTGVHLFDLVRFLAEQEFQAVNARTRQILNPVVEDCFTARASLTDGCWVEMEVSKYTDSRACWLEVVGEQGQLQADYLRGGLRWRHGQQEEEFEISARVPTLPAVLGDWLAAVQTRTAPPVTARDGLRTMQVVAACYDSARSQQEVTVATTD